MRIRWTATATAVVLVAAAAATAVPAMATDVCRKAVSATSAPVRGWKPAMAAAQAEWQRQATRRYGRGFGNWWYSGDRAIDCTWDDRGVMYRCRATALPCGRA